MGAVWAPYSHPEQNNRKYAFGAQRWAYQAFFWVTELASYLQVPPQISKAFLKQVQIQHTNPNQTALLVVLTPASSVT